MNGLYIYKLLNYFGVNYWIMVKELEDYTWFPTLLRQYQVDFIGNLVQWLRLYQPLVPIAQQLMLQRQLRYITDCCSGNGSPAVYLHQRLHPTPTTKLTDQFPPSFLPTDGVSYEPHPVNVLQLNPQPNQLYTMYNSFHHFTSAEQQMLLQRFADKQASVMIAEILEPDIFTLLKICLTTTIGQLLMAPFVRPFSWKRLVFTYLLPINLVTVTYDGIISVIKSKTVNAYAQLVAGIPTTDYTFTVKRIKQAMGNIIYITGHPNS